MNKLQSEKPNFLIYGEGIEPPTLPVKAPSATDHNRI